MATQHILCVHGIGLHTNTWIETTDDGDISFKEQFLDRWQNLINTHSYQPRHDLQFHSIHYDDAINKLLSNWVEQLESLSNGLAGKDDFSQYKDYFDKVINKAKEAEQEESFVITHLLDLLVFAGLYSVQDSILVNVGNQIGEILVNQVDYARGDQVCVIGHSLGTAVTEKTIKALFNEHAKVDGINYTLTGNHKLLAVMLVANVSYTLARDRSTFYDSLFRPGTGETQIMSHLLNVNHKLDPVGQFLPFDPFRHNPDWITARHRKRYHDIEISRLSSNNIHSINHYFRDPDVYLPLFEILGDRPIAQSVKTKLLVEFENETPLGKFKSFRTSLENLKVTNMSSMKDFYDKAKALHDLINQFK